MHIVRIYPKLPSLKGGMEQHIKSLTQEQIRAGMHVTIIFNRGTRISDQDIQILPPIALHRIRPRAIGFLLFYLVTFIYLLWTGKKADILHIHGDWSSFMLAGRMKKRLGAKKLFFSIHGAVKHYPAYKKWLLIQSVKQADMVFCNGYEAFEYLAPFTSAVFQPSGVREAFFKKYPVKKPEVFTLITVAKQIPSKNLETILKIAGRFPDYRFILVGDGPSHSRLIMKAKEMQLQNIRFLGFLSGEKTAAELQKADAFLLASSREGTPTAVLEAVVSGLPVICSGAGGIGHLLNEGENGYIIDDPMDENAFAARIKILATDPEKRSQIGQNNIQLSESLSWEKVAGRISRLIGHE